MKKVIFEPSEDTVPASALQTATFIGVISKDGKGMYLREPDADLIVNKSLAVVASIFDNDILSKSEIYSEVFIFDDLQELITWLCQ